MSKYIDADLLRKDIDNWKVAMTDAVGEYSDGVRFALEHFTFILDSLQQEQQEESDKNLEEAAYKYSFDSKPSIYGQVDVIDAFIAGAEWQKEQMMKEAVEGKVIKTDKHTSVRYKSFYGTDRYFYGIADKQFKPGNKVRIIVLKAEEEKK